MFSNKNRWFKIALSLILLSSLCYYAPIEVKRRYPHIGYILEHADAFEGKVVYREVAAIVDVDSSCFFFRELNRIYQACFAEQVEKPKIHKGAHISFKAIIKNGKLYITQWHFNSRRRWKIYFSLGAALIMSIWFVALIFGTLKSKDSLELANGLTKNKN